MAEQGTLFGENVDQPFDQETARGQVLTGIQQFMKPQLQKARGSLSQRGFGRYNAPTIEGQVINPLLQTGAESVRRALTDLHYKERSQSLAERAQQFKEDAFNEQMHIGRQKRSQKVLCTELYRQGLLPLSHIKADLKYLKYHVDKETHENYLRWAIPFVEVMKKSKIVTYLIWLPVLCWSEYMKSVVYNKRLGIRAMIGFVWQKAAVQFGKWYKNRLQKVEVA